MPAVINGNDEYALEAALKLVEAAGEGEVTVLAMAPASAPETIRKALAMGATRGVLVTDPALEGSCTVSTTRVLAAALRTLEFDIAIAGVDSSDGQAGVVPAGIAALGELPYMSYAARIEPDMSARTVRVRRISPTGYDVLEAPMPALISGTQALGEPRYPSLKGIMAARGKEIRTVSLADLGLDGASVGGQAATTRVVGSRPPEARAATRVDPGHARGGGPADRRLPRGAEAHLVSGRILVVGELGPDGRLTKLSTEVATLAGALADAAGTAVDGLIPVVEGVSAADADRAAGELAPFVDSVMVDGRSTAAQTVAPVAAALSTLAADYDAILLPASPDGRDIAGALSALTGLGVLANATAARWTADGPVVEMSAFGGKLITESAFVSGRGIITVRPNAVTAAPRASAGSRAAPPTADSPVLAPVRVVDRVEEGAAAVSIDDARIIVSGGRGMGGADGFKLVEDLAQALGGAVGATRAAVDSGWIPYAQQIGQTGKIVKPQLYLALGISGAIQHKVGMQTSGTIIAVNRDADAPIAEFADLFVVGDLFEVGPALLTALRARPA